MHSETTTPVYGPREVTQMGGFLSCFSGGKRASIGSVTRCRLEKAKSATKRCVCRGAPWDRSTMSPFGLWIGMEAACC